MPTYKNKSHYPITINSVNFKFLEETPVSFYVDLEKYPDLIKVSDDPVYDPIQYSEVCEAGSSVEFFDKIGDDTTIIRLVSLEDVSEIIFNDEKNHSTAITSNTPLELHNINNYKSIHVKSGKVSVELWKAFYWRY